MTIQQSFRSNHIHRVANSGPHCRRETFRSNANPVRIIAIVCLTSTILLHVAMTAAAETPLPLELSWRRLKEEGKLKDVDVVVDEGTHKGPLKVVSPLKAPAESPSIVHLLDIEEPQIGKQIYVLSGQLRYQDVAGTGYLEMWSVFADGSHYFSRTLGTDGPMKSLQGSSDWRLFQLPFQLEAGPNAKRPNRLIVNVVFPGAGTVWLGDLTLTERESLFEMPKPATTIAAAQMPLPLEVSWNRLKEEGKLKELEVVADEGTHKGPIKVVSPLKAPAEVPSVVPLLEINAPQIGKQVFVLSGQVRHQDVAGTGYLEMWTLFADGGHYFSRTLGSAGPMRSLQGSSDWRSFELPFQLEAGPNAKRPNRLLVNVVYPGQGTVWLGDLTLTEIDSPVATTKPATKKPVTLIAAAQMPLPLELSWRRLKEEGKLKELEVVADEGTHKGPIKIMSPLKELAKSPSDVPLLEIDSPQIGKQVYVLSGQVRYQDVAGTGYVEMWSVFADGSRYFSRTLGSEGPMQSLEGSSDWRSFQLPFQLEAGPNAARPKRLIVNVVFPGQGTVWFGDLTLTEIDSLFSMSAPGAWWSDRMGGLIGGLGGSLFGLLGAATGVLVSRGLARRFVLSLTGVGVALGIVMLGAGVAAVILRQPYGVYYPLLLGGGLATGLCAAGLFSLPSRYAALELRRMEALDVGA